MGKNQSASGLTNIIQYDNAGNISFVSGSTTLLAISSSGAVTTTGVISGSDAANAISASYAQAATSASFASNATSASFALNATSASQAQNAVSSSFALNAATATSASQAQNAVSSSFAANAANANLLDSKDSTEFAITGSNIFTGIQYITDTSNPNGFGASASIYTDGGLRVTKDTYVSGTMFVNNLTVFGTQSINYITSSQLNISTNIISVNTDTPSIRFGGLSVYDSGSTGLTGSMLWDSERDHWVYSNPSGSSYSGGMIMSGPRSSALGSEQGTLNNFVMKGQGGDHITSSQIIDDGTTVRIPGNLQVTGSVVLSSALTGSNATFSSTITASGNISTSGTLIGRTTTNGQAFGCGNGIDSDMGIFVQTNNIAFSNSGTNSGVSFALGGSTRFSIASTGAATFAAASGGAITLTTNGSANNWTSAITGNSTTSQSYGLLIQAGTNSTDAALRVRNQANNVDWLFVRGDGNVGIGTISPATFLHINGATAALPNGSGTTQSAGNRIRLSTAAGTGILDIGCAGGTGMWLQSTDLTDLNLKYPILLNPNGGNVGIGTGAPDYRLDVNGVTQIRDTLLTTKQVGFNYSQTSTSGTTSLVNTGIFYNTSITGFSNNGTYLLVVTGNPNALGSNEYRAVYLGYITINTGYDFGITNVVQRISYTQIVAADAFNIGTLTISAVFWNGTTETTQQVNGTTNNQIRIKITGYNSSAIGAAQEVRLTKIVG